MSTPLTNNSQVIVKKFGGATVASPEKIKEVAQRIKLESAKGAPLVIVVSAMGKTTNNLIELANQVSSHPSRREMDMLLSVGERISMSLLSMALLDLGLEAISFTGSQAGILTNDSHENAKIMGIKPIRLKEELLKNKIIILAGFQGVSSERKEITTLGRGGSDTSAVAMTAALHGEHCEILKDVPSIFTADPSLVKTARAIEKLSYEELMEMTFWGAKVLHYRSAELAAIKRVKLYIGPSKLMDANASPKEAQGTWIKDFKNKEFEMIFNNSSSQFEADKIITINSHQEVLKLNVKAANQFEALSKIKSELHAKEIIFPQILNVESLSGGDFSFIVTAPSEVISQIKKAQFTFTVSPDALCCIALTCTGLPSFETQEKIYRKLSETKIETLKTFISSMSLALVISKAKQEEAIKVLHQLIET